MSSRRESDFVRLEQLLREADDRAEQERKRAQEANERAELERQRAEDEERSRKEAEQRAELERQHAEDEERSRKEAEQRAELERQRAEDEERSRKEAEQRAELERQRAQDEERSRKEAEQRAELERQRAEDEEKKTRRTIFKEYIHTCYTLLSKPLRIQTDKSLSIQGSITSPKNRPCPTLLKPWTDFPIQQQQLFETVYGYIPQDEEYFSSIQYLTELGQDLCDRPLASEKDLEAYQCLAVERPTTNIILRLRGIKKARKALNLGDGIVFENYANTLADTNEDIQESLRNLQLSSRQQLPSSKAKDSDQICVYKETGRRGSVCMVIEYKPSYKLSVYNLQAGLLRANSGSMNLPEDVINRPTIPTDPEEKFVYHSEWLVGAALTQTYGYMVENGLEYSYLTTGEAFVFLQIKESEPHMLYYHLAEPNTEAEAQNEVDILLSRTAVSQASTFCLLALGSKPRNQKWRNHTLETAYRAVIDHEAVLRQIPVEEKALSPPASVFKARIHPFERSPIILRPRKPRKTRNSCDSLDMKVHEDLQSPTGLSDESSDIKTPSKPRPYMAQSRIKQHQVTLQAAESDVCQRQYCIQACLLGLVRRWPLDEMCPNVSVHRALGASGYHVLDYKTLVQLMLCQLALDPDNGCELLGKQGARGALFRLLLELHGYTFVAKGTVTVFKAKLKHESSIYRKLNDVQGELIPVYLGNITLVCPYFLDFNVRIVHMLLISWAGEQVQKELMSCMGLDIDVETSRAVVKLRLYGVEYCDVRLPNVLWNPDGGKVMLVDFERSEVLNQVPIL
jgi:hypothetical protein